MQDLPRSEAFDRLKEGTGWYDPAVLQALKIVFVPEQKFQLSSLSLSELQPHMVLADPILDTMGNLLLAKGQDPSEWIVTRLKQMGGARSVKQPIRVILPVSSSEEEVVPSLRPQPVMTKI